MSVLDEEVLNALERDLGGPEVVREVVQLFLELLPQRRQAISDAAAAADLARLRREAHTLGSASAMVGAVDLRGACRRLESGDSPAEGAALDFSLPALSRSCSQAEAALASWISTT